METKKRKKLKIAVVVKSFISTGGSERYAFEVTRRLLDKGHEVDLYARSVDMNHASGLNIHKVLTGSRVSSVLDSVIFAKETARMLKGKKYDVIHSHERGYAQDILTIHTFSYRGSMFKYPIMKRIHRIYLSPRSALYLWLENRQMKSPWLIAVSDTIRQDILKFYPNSRRINVIPPGVDTEKFNPNSMQEQRERIRKEKNIAEEEMVVLFVGSEFRRKGLDRLIPAMRPGMRLFVVGKGERQRYYQSLVEKSANTDKVTFEGHSHNVGKYYALADVVVLPSRSEAFGMSILEGMSCGHPVVASSVSGVSSLIQPGVNGFLFEHSSEIPAILEGLMDPLERKRVGIEARKKAENYTWNAVADAHEKIFKEISEIKKRWGTRKSEAHKEET